MITLNLNSWRNPVPSKCSRQDLLGEILNAACGFNPQSKRITIVKDHPEDELKRALGLPVDVIRLKCNDPDVQKVIDGN